MPHDEKVNARDTLASVGNFAAAVAHELSNVGAILSIVHDARDLAAEGQPSPELVRNLDLLSAGIERFFTTLEALRTYATVGSEVSIVRAAVDLNDVVARVGERLQPFPRTRALVEFNVMTTNEAVVVQGDARKLEFVMWALARNATDSASQGGGVVILSVASEGDHGVIRVTDNGAGVSEADAEALWSGMYTTKPGRGTGLSLMLARAIVAAHGGSLDYANESSGGVTFTAAIPRS